MESAKAAPVCVPACEEDSVIYLLINGAVHKTDESAYEQWRRTRRNGVPVIAERSFPHAHDIEFELLMPMNFLIENMWAKDLLQRWWWQKHKTGILTPEERLDALAEAAKLPPQLPPVLI